MLHVQSSGRARPPHPVGQGRAWTGQPSTTVLRRQVHADTHLHSYRTHDTRKHVCGHADTLREQLH